MKNIQGRDLYLNAKHSLPSGTAGAQHVHTGVRAAVPLASQAHFLSEKEGVLPHDLQRLYLNSYKPKYLVGSATTHLPFV